MKKFNYKLNIDSVFISSLINIFYLIPLFLILLIINLLKLNVKLEIQFYLIIIYILLIEIIHQFILSKKAVVNFAYILKNKVEQFKTEELYICASKLFTVLNIIFIIYTIVYFCYFQFIDNNYGNNEQNVFAIVPNIITIASIILTLILALLQYCSNKFPDFTSLFVKWKKDTISLFVILVFYFILSLASFYFKEPININFWIYIASNFLVVQLCLIGCQAIILMNDTDIINVKKHQVLNLVKKMPRILKTEEMIKKSLNPSFMENFKKFVSCCIFGIVGNEIYDLSDYFGKQIKPEIESLYRTANIYIEKDNLILFKTNIKAINEIVHNITVKTKGTEHFDIYEYYAAKQKLLFDNMIKLKREGYFEEILESNVHTIKDVINFSEVKYDKLTNLASLSFLIEQISYITIRTVVFKHTTVTNNAIAKLREIANCLLHKNDRYLVGNILETLKIIAIVVDRIYQSKKYDVEKFWTGTIIGQALYAQLNIIFYIVMFSLDSGHSYDYLLDKAVENYLEVFKILSKYNHLNSNPANTLHATFPNTSYEILYNCIARNMDVKTPYRNMLLNGSNLYIDKVSCMSEIFGHVFIADLENDRMFNTAISNLIKILNAINKIPSETMDDIALNNLIDFYKDIVKSAFLFMERIDKLDFHTEKLTNLIKKFLLKVLDVSHTAFIKFYEKITYPDFFTKYVYFLIDFLYLNRNINKDNTYLNQKIYEKIENIINLLKDKQDLENYHRLFSNIKLLSVLLFGFNKETDTFKKIFEFVNSNEEKSINDRHFYSIWEEEQLPYGSEYKVGQKLLEEYILYKSESFN